MNIAASVILAVTGVKQTTLEPGNTCMCPSDHWVQFKSMIPLLEQHNIQNLNTVLVMRERKSLKISAIWVRRCLFFPQSIDDVIYKKV